MALFPQPPAPTVESASDASGSWGCGAWCGEQWWQWQWPKSVAEDRIQGAVCGRRVRRRMGGGGGAGFFTLGRTYCGGS